MSPSPETEAGRLNGWKEIAAHLGKGARTVQRWEKLYGLPVHRIGREGGEIIFAFPDEIDRWVSARERERSDGEEAFPLGEVPDPAGGGATSETRAAAPPGRRGGARLAVAVGAMVLVAAVLGGLSLSFESPGKLTGRRARPTPTVGGQGAPGRKPAGWRLAVERFTVFDAAGETLFEHDLGFPVNASSSTDLSKDDRSPVLVADVDEDGESEVLLAAPAVARENCRLYCFGADGRLRFVHQPTGRVRFGGKEYAEPWLAHRVFVTQSPAGRKSLWAVFTHNLWFPARLQELDRFGAVKGEYWSNGYVETVSEGIWKSRSVVFVGAANNEFKGASLAIFDREGVSGSAPASRPDYVCSSCHAGHPLEFVVFPSLCLLARKGSIAAVTEAWVEGGERVMVRVLDGIGSPGGNTPAGELSAYYTLGPDLVPVHAEISPEFQAVHTALEKQGLLDHRFGPGDSADMFPVRRWDGRRFVELPQVPVAH